MAANPSFATTPRIGVGQVSAANTNRDGSGTIVDVLTGVAAGTKIMRVVVQAIVTTTAGMIRLYLDDGAGAVRLFDEIPVAAITVAASTPGFRAERIYDDLVLPNNNWKLRASTHNAETFNVEAFGADL